MYQSQPGQDGVVGRHTGNTSWNDDNVCTSQGLLLCIFRLLLLSFEVTLGRDKATDGLFIISSSIARIGRKEQNILRLRRCEKDQPRHQEC